MVDEVLQVSPQDAWLLSYLSRLPPQKQDKANDLIAKLSTDDSRKIGLVLLGEAASDPAIDDIVKALRAWNKRNQLPTRKELMRRRMKARR